MRYALPVELSMQLLNNWGLFVKCDEMRLRSVFTVKTVVTLLKSIFEFVLNRARSNFIQGALAEVLGESFTNKLISSVIFLVVA